MIKKYLRLLDKQKTLKGVFLMLLIVLMPHGSSELSAGRKNRIKKGCVEKARKFCLKGKRKFATVITAIFVGYISLAVLRNFLYDTSLSFALAHPLRVFFNSDLPCLKGQTSPAIIRAYKKGNLAKIDLKEKLNILQTDYSDNDKVNGNEFISLLNHYFFIEGSLDKFIDPSNGKFNAAGIAKINEKLCLLRETNQATLQLKASIINYLEKRALFFELSRKFDKPN